MEPLANKIRPKTLDEFVGQEHLVGEGKPLRTAIDEGHVMSFILWGPPGTGKTTLARMYAQALKADFYELSAVDSGKEDIKNILGLSQAARKGRSGPLGQVLPFSHGLLELRPKVLFIDEIHRFNKAQQDFLLPFVERGDLTLVGATTENPSFEVISALLSRTRVFVLEDLSEEHMGEIIDRAAKVLKTKIPKAAREWLVALAAGDARQAINVLEHTHTFYRTITVDTLKRTVQTKHLRYDKKGEEHFNTISAFIKSMRASQGDAALYYLARMVEAGEDPLFIARRMVVFASEDVGLAVPTALVVANAVFRACETVGYPECAINLAHGVAYLSECKKSRNSHDAYFEAVDDVKKHGNLPVPLKVRNAPTKLMKNLGYGKDYKMYPSRAGDKESYLPDKLKGKKYLK